MQESFCLETMFTFEITGIAKRYVETTPGAVDRGAHEGLCEVLMQPNLRAMLED